MSWIERNTVIYKLEELPFDDTGKLVIIDVSKVRVQIPGYVYAFDFGSWCYTERKKIHCDTSSEKCSVVAVKLSSFRSSRKLFVTRYLEFLNNYLNFGRSGSSLKSNVCQFITFVKWCDVNMPHALDNHDNISMAVALFSDELMHKIRSSKLSVNTAATLQGIAISTLQVIFGEENQALFDGIRRIRRSQAATVVTESPDEEDAKFALNTYLNIYNQLTEFVLNFAPYPMELKLSHRSYWCFPKPIPFKQSNKTESKNLSEKKYFAYNYLEGRLNSADEILKKMAWASNVQTKAHAIKILDNAKNNMLLANSNKFHHQRLLCGTLASSSFLMLFSANTGMSLSQISNLKWDSDHFEIVKDRQGFKAVKYRANGKSVSFLISSSFVELFKKYLKLRKYLLESQSDQSFQNLFFIVSNGKVKPISMNTSNYFNARLKRLFDIDITITTKQWRAYKSDWLIRNTDLVTTAMVLQNDPQTVLKHYITGSDKSATLELTAYFEDFNQKLIIDPKESKNSLSIGQCKSIESPSPITFTSKFSPDCKKPEGCLFCEHFAVHADEVDLKKLLSFKYLIEQTRSLSSSSEHFQELYSPVISRIENVIDKITSTNLITEKMQLAIRQEVYEFEMLDRFWDRKLQMLVDLELI